MLICTLLFSGVSYSQSGLSAGPAETEFEGFSGVLLPAKSSRRGGTSTLESLSAFSPGNLRSVELASLYKRIFLGNDFFDEVRKMDACDSLKNKLGNIKSHFIPVSDGKFFRQHHLSKIEELEGFYRFRNSKNLPGILPNVDVLIRMESYKHGKSTEKNCLIIKFLIPEDVNGQIVNKTYAMRNDGILVSIPPGTDPDFSLKLDFSKYCIFPLNDPQETTHLVGKDFSILGSFAEPQRCDAFNGLLFPISRKGTDSGCVFSGKFQKNRP